MSQALGWALGSGDYIMGIDCCSSLWLSVVMVITGRYETTKKDTGNQALVGKGDHRVLPRGSEACVLGRS